jgi:hypothetical protein
MRDTIEDGIGVIDAPQGPIFIDTAIQCKEHRRASILCEVRFVDDGGESGSSADEQPNIELTNQPF